MVVASKISEGNIRHVPSSDDNNISLVAALYFKLFEGGHIVHLGRILNQEINKFRLIFKVSHWQVATCDKYKVTKLSLIALRVAMN